MIIDRWVFDSRRKIYSLRRDFVSWRNIKLELVFNRYRCFYRIQLDGKRYFLSMIFSTLNATAWTIKNLNVPLRQKKISKSTGYFCAVVLMIFGLIISYQINFTCFEIIFFYILINILYSVWLKHFMIIDVLIISYCFVSQIVIIQMTMWFILCVMFLSLFLSLGKRQYDFHDSVWSGVSAIRTFKSKNIPFRQFMTARGISSTITYLNRKNNQWRSAARYKGGYCRKT